MRLVAVIGCGLLIAASASAHPREDALPKRTVARAPSASQQESAVRAVLADYQAAIERLDVRGTERLFTADSQIFESGSAEGTYSNYLAHHLVPELKEFRSFRYANYQLSVRFEGRIALSTETYSYRIETTEGEIAERLGVATSVLKNTPAGWKIISMHNSARKPKGN